MADVIKRGDPSPDKKLLIMVHGRGATADDILSLSKYLELKNFSLVAPQAPGYTWYPHSFLVPQSQNQPHLDRSLSIIEKIVADAISKGVDEKNIFFLGFSQGACLSLEYTARHAKKWGGVVAFTGGLIGDTLQTENYKGNFAGTPIYIGTSDPDPHVPLSRVHETEKVLNAMGANVTVDVFKNMGHTINETEITKANTILQ